jgi:hypothetical protein
LTGFFGVVDRAEEGNVAIMVDVKKERNILFPDKDR